MVQYKSLAELNRHLTMPLAGGENNRGLHEFRQMCTDGVYDILQPEPLVASWPHAPYWELLHDPPVGAYENRFVIFKEAPKAGKDGWIDVPQGPGLGVEIDPSLIV